MQNKPIQETQQILGSKELQKIAKLNFIGGETISKLILRILSIDKLNEMYENYDGPGGLHFIRFAIKKLNLSYDINTEALENIPREGAFVTVSNHPYGGVDGIGIFNMLLPIRPTYKTISNYMMRRMKPLCGNFIAVDPFVTNGKAQMNIAGIKQAIKHLQDGNPLGLFPAGEVSSYNGDYSGICDKKWDKSIMRVAQRANVPVVPVYFHGNNSKFFHFLGRIHPALRTAKIPSEIINKMNTKIKITVGKPIDVETLKQYKSIDSYIEFLREKTYELADSDDTTSDNHDANKKPTEKVETVAPQLPINELQVEIDKLTKNNSVFKKGTFELFCTKSDNIPSLMHEIGRQREITFRAVGEGSNKALDLDEYDEKYHHLIIWDHAEDKLVGAYRIGNGKELMKTEGIDGFYTNTLFKFDQKIAPVLSQSMELGRSFVTQEYQRKAMPLYMLWAGIFRFAKQNPWCKYLFGPVSVSDDLSKDEKDQIVSYIKKHHYSNKLQHLVSPRTPYTVSNNYSLTHDNPKLRDIKIPILFRKYLDINGEILEFNVDPLFNNSLDGLILVELSKIPCNFAKRFSEQKKQVTLKHNPANVSQPQICVGAVS